MKHERRQKIEEKVGFEIPRTEVHRQLWAKNRILAILLEFRPSDDAKTMTHGFSDYF